MSETRLEVSIRPAQEGFWAIEADLKAGSAHIGLVPVEELVQSGSLRALMRVHVLDEDMDYVMVQPCSDITWRLLPEFQGGFWAYKADLAYDLPVQRVTGRQDAIMSL